MKIIHNEFPKMFKDLKSTKKNYEAFLQLKKVILYSIIRIKIKSVIKFFYFLIK
tara:strand:- start:258 stop:419 length:162 start_codon:yes stop_codon:yes gene_type:complete